MAASMTARSTAINRNLRVIIEPMSGTDWTSGWRVYVDKDGSTDFDASKDEQIIVVQGHSPIRCGRAIYFRRKEMDTVAEANRFVKSGKP